MIEMLSTEYWVLFPVGVLVATMGMSSGISGSNFWIPIYLIAMELEPAVAFWMSLLTMLFGFGSGVVRNVADGTISWPLVRRYARVALPAAAVCAVIAARLDQRLLILAFSCFALVYGGSMFVGAWRGLEARSLPGPISALLGGAFQGAIATGAGTWMLPSLLDEPEIEHHASAVGSSVVVLFGCSLVAVVLRMDPMLIDALMANRADVANMVVFAAPGVLIGGQLGPRVAQRLPQAMIRPYVGGLLILVAVFVASRAI